MFDILLGHLLFYLPYATIFYCGLFLILTPLQASSSFEISTNELLSHVGVIFGLGNLLFLVAYLFGILGNHYVKVYSYMFNFVALLVLPWFQNGWTNFAIIIITNWIPSIVSLVYMSQVSSISPIIPNVFYLGNAKAARTKHVLEQCGITHILELHDGGSKNNNDNIAKQAGAPIILLALECQDTLGSEDSLPAIASKALEFLDNATDSNEKAVLVHCSAGVSRSAAMTLLWLLKTTNPKYKSDQRTLKDAYKFIRKARPIVDINVDHIKAIQKLANN